MPLTLSPSTITELADVVRAANTRGETLTLWGTGTRQHLGHPPHPAAQLLSTGRLCRLVEHIPADMTVSVEAGMTLGELQATLRQQKQWLPWDPPAPPEATIGGLLATAASGPLRLGYGVSRDWILGMRVVLGDGRIVKSGGKVVKNVAGYDTHKLHIGALGTLGVIAEATFKVFPLPETTASLLVSVADPATAIRFVEALRAAPLAPVSLNVFNTAQDTNGTAWSVAARYAGTTAAVERQLDLAMRNVHGAQSRYGEDDVALWRSIAQFSQPVVNEAHLILRAAARPSDLAAVLAACVRHAPVAPALVGYGGTGLAYARWHATSDLANAVAALRDDLGALGGYVEIEHAPSSQRATLDLWGEPPATLPYMRVLRHQWDPQGTLNRGRYLVD